jgi:bacillithiol system protein YtxJ
MAIIELRQTEDLEKLLEKSDTKPVLIFKHSTQCPISAAAFDEFNTFARRAGDVPCGLLLVIENRSLSQAVATELGIRHESPQAIVVSKRKPTWNASHFAITSDALNQALKP